MTGCRTMRNFLIAALFLFTALTLFAGCGVKAPPVPADLLLPARVSLIRYHFDESGRVVLSFQAPSVNRLDKPLGVLGGFFIDRSENRLEPGFCPGCPVTFTRRVRLEARPPDGGAAVWSGWYEYTDEPAAGYVYHYRVYAFDAKGRYDRSQFRSLVIYYDSPSRPPDAVRAKTDDRLVTLSWAPPERLADGRPLKDLVGYNIYRRAEGAQWTRLNGDEPWPLTTYEDRQVENGRTYPYRVRAVRRFHQTVIEGASSPAVGAMPLDLTPPPPPVNLVAALAQTGISLRWQEVEAPDLAGYNVYRRAEDEARFSKITPAPLKDPAFLDRTALPGKRYIYRVTAVDKAVPGNESEPGEEMSIRFTQ